MDSVRLDISNNFAAQQNSGAERSEALARARRKLQADTLSAERIAQQSQSELTAASREVIEQALGTNTRLSIEQTDAQDVFVYRAVDKVTGEVVNEWPPQQFVEFVRQVQSDQSNEAAEIQSGTIIDEEA